MVYLSYGLSGILCCRSSVSPSSANSCNRCGTTVRSRLHRYVYRGCLDCKSARAGLWPPLSTPAVQTKKSLKNALTGRLWQARRKRAVSTTLPTYLSARQKTLEATTHRLLSFVSALPGADRHNYKANFAACKRFSAPPPNSDKQREHRQRHKPADEAASASALEHDASWLIGIHKVEVFEDFHCTPPIGSASANSATCSIPSPRISTSHSGGTSQDDSPT